MNATQLLVHFDRLSEAPDAVPRLRRFILDLAVRGKLVEQDSSDELAVALLKRIQTEKARLVKLGLAKAGKPLSEIEGVNAALIPSSWHWSRLAEVGFISPRNAATDDQLVSFVPMPMIAADYGTPNLQEVRLWREVKSGYTHFAEGDVGLAKITPCFENGKSTVFRGLTNGIGAGTTELHIVRPVLLSPDYILIFLKSSRYIATGIPRMTGTAGQKRVPTEYFTQSPFPLPPLAEQHRIVAKVDELMALCDQLEAAQQERERRRDRLAAASLQRLNQPTADTTPEAQREHARFHLHHLPRLTTRPEHIKAMRRTIRYLAISGRLVTQQTTDEPVIALLKKIQVERAQREKDGLSRKSKPALPMQEEEKLLSLPSHWVWSRLASLVFLLGDGLHGTPTYTEGTEYYFINGNNLVDGKIFIKSHTKTVSFDEWQQHKKPMSSNAVLVSINGTLGNVAFYNHEQVVLGKSACYFNLADCIDKRFIKLVIESQYFIDYAVMSATGTTINNLSLKAMNELPVPLPPLAEQHRIVAKVDELMAQCDQLEAQLTTTQTDSRRLLEAVLDAALVK